MSVDFANIKWKSVGLGVGIAFLISIGVTFGVITGYAGYLAFEAQAAPDMEMISAFTNRVSGGTVAVFTGIGAFAGSLYAARKADTDVPQNGMMVGVITAVITLLLNTLSIWTMVSVLLALGGGWLGGRFAASKQP